jgi:hypothetical protein
MELRPLGRTGVSVRKLCLGHTMFGEYGTKDHDESIKIIHRAIDPGITFVDTADVCSQGDSEVIVVGWWQRMRTGATRQRALLHPGRRPRCSRCRSVRPELTGIGAAPQRRANAASERCRSGSPPGRTDVARRDAVTGTSPAGTRDDLRCPVSGRSPGRQRATTIDHCRPVDSTGAGGRRTSRPVRRILSPGRSRVAAIHLGLPSPAGSSGLPAGSGGQPSNACAGPWPEDHGTLLALLRVGFTEPRRSPGALVGSYPTVSPLPGRAWRSVFCGTVPRVTPGCR